jgi:hypothetical protein
MEFGKQGTVDVFSTNSINLRTKGTLNLHADKNINMYAGGTIKIKAQEKMFIESGETLVVNSLNNLVLAGAKKVGIRSDGSLGIKSKQGGWEATASLNFKGKVINLNGAPTPPVPEIPPLPNYKLADTKFDATEGWTIDTGTLETIVTRAPTHEPYPYHNKGVNNKTNLNSTPASQNPVASSASATTASVSSSTIPASTSATTSSTTPTSAAITGQTELQTKTANKVLESSRAPLTKAISAENYISEIPAVSDIGREAQEIYNIGQRLAKSNTTPTVNPALAEQIVAVERAQGQFKNT